MRQANHCGRKCDAQARLKILRLFDVLCHLSDRLQKKWVRGS